MILAKTYVLKASVADTVWFAAVAAEGTVNVTVRHVNQPPALAPIGALIGTTPNALQVNEGTKLSFTVVGSDPDSGAVLVYSLVGNTAAGASINSSTA